MKTLLYLLLFLPFIVKAQSKDTVKVVMLVSDTSSIVDVRPTDVTFWAKGERISETRNYNYVVQDTRPYMTYGYQTKKGELLDAYKRKLGKNIVMWIAYKIK